MAQDLVAGGADLAAVMQAGRWKSPTMPARYAERLLAKRGAVASHYAGAADRRFLSQPTRPEVDHPLRTDVSGMARPLMDRAR